MKGSIKSNCTLHDQTADPSRKQRVDILLGHAVNTSQIKQTQTKMNARHVDDPVN